MDKSYQGYTFGIGKSLDKKIKLPLQEGESITLDGVKKSDNILVWDKFNQIPYFEILKQNSKHKPILLYLEYSSENNIIDLYSTDIFGTIQYSSKQSKKPLLSIKLK